MSDLANPFSPPAADPAETTEPAGETPTVASLHDRLVAVEQAIKDLIDPPKP